MEMEMEPEECKDSLFELGTSEIDIDTKRFESVDVDLDLFHNSNFAIGSTDVSLHAWFS